MKPGDQIVYIPDHAKGDPKHPDCEFGFVTSISPGGEYAWCRYWIKTEKGVLRTYADSELTPAKYLQPAPGYVNQNTVDVLMKALGY